MVKLALQGGIQVRLEIIWTEEQALAAIQNPSGSKALVIGCRGSHGRVVCKTKRVL